MIRPGGPLPVLRITQPSIRGAQWPGDSRMTIQMTGNTLGDTTKDLWSEQGPADSPAAGVDAREPNVPSRHRGVLTTATGQFRSWERRSARAACGREPAAKNNSNHRIEGRTEVLEKSVTCRLR